MHAFVLSGSFGLENVSRVELPTPKPGHGQLAVRVRAASLNYRDLLITRGWYNPKLNMPAAFGSDLAGEVIAVGPGVSRFQVGDRVTGCFFPGWTDGPVTDTKVKSSLGDGWQPGALSQEVVLPEEGLVASPSCLTDEECATLLFALQFAKAAGAKVMITSSQSDKLERAAKLGADVGINYSTEPNWDGPVCEHTGGIGADHVIELGGAGTMATSIRAVKRGGVISLIGVLSGLGQIDPMPILMRSIRLQGIFVGSRAMFERMNRAIEMHNIKPVIGRVFPFEETPAALAYMESGSHFGKIVIRVS